MLKKLLSFVLCSAMVFSASSNLFASEPPISTREELIQIIKTKEGDERNTSIEALLSETPLEVSDEQRNTNSVETFDIDKDTSISFLPDGNFAVDELIDTGKKPIIEEDDRSVNAMRYTSVYQNTKTLYNNFGGTIVHTWVNGYFGYDGYSQPVAYIDDAGYNKGFLIMWEVYNWQESTAYHYSYQKAYCYAKAYYNWGINVEVSGEKGGAGGSASGGITIQDYNLDLRLYCDKKGYISKN